LETDSFGKEAAANQWLLPVIIRHGRVIVARNSNGELLGVCLAIRNWSDSWVAFIHSFHIKKDYRGKGLGTKFLSKTIEIMKKENIKTIRLTVSPKNTGAVRLYKKHGFEVKELKKDEYGRGVDRFLMERKL